MKKQYILGHNASKRQRGSSMVEGALVCLALLSIILFIVNVGTMLALMQLFNQRAQAGARWAANNSFDESAIKNIVVYNDPRGSSGPGLLGLKASNVSISRLDAGSVKDRIAVQISGYSMVFFVPFLPGTYSVPSAVAVAPVESLGSPN